ncbi:MAG: cyclic nucleotide-binding domain-containing protein [Panacagrimonas sp.]
MSGEYTYLANAAFVLLALSYVIRDILYLRIIAIVASCFMIAFNVMAYPQPIWVIIYWNIAFMSINSVHIARLLRARSTWGLSEQQLSLRRDAFPRIGIAEFRKLMSVAQWRQAESGETLMREGVSATMPELLYLFAGHATVSVDGRHVASLRNGAFIGEMGLLTDGKPAATVTADEPSQLVCWPKKALLDMLRANPGLYAALQTILAREAVVRLQNTGLRDGGVGDSSGP